MLIVGGGLAGTEKITFLLKNSPDANVTIVAKEISDEIKTLATGHKPLMLIEKEYETIDLHDKQLVIAATENKELNLQIYKDAKAKNILINVADTPELCDFYLGSIVTKGDLKIAISTNGKSPTLSKRLREFFEEILPENINDLILHLQEYRNTIKGSLQERVEKLNKLTKSLLDKK
jgi:precorrin-2 dehydrogenase/sirohydrochlorin ferrochelatase